MTDRFHVDAYVGEVHDRSDSLANDAYVAFLRLIHSGRTAVSTNREERGAVPTILHSTRPDLHAKVSVDRYAFDDVRSGVTVGVEPSADDQLRTSVRVIMEDVGSLFADDASEEDVARIVLETAAVHLGKAIQGHLDAFPDEKRTDGHGPEKRFTVSDQNVVAAVVRDASVATIGADAGDNARVVIGTPWSPMRAHAGGRPVEVDAAMAAVIPTILSIYTAFAFTDANGRGTSGTIRIVPLTAFATVVGPMERLRAMNDARNSAAAA